MYPRIQVNQWNWPVYLADKLKLHWKETGNAQVRAGAVRHTARHGRLVVLLPAGSQPAVRATKPLGPE